MITSQKLRHCKLIFLTVCLLVGFALPVSFVSGESVVCWIDSIEGNPYQSGLSQCFWGFVNITTKLTYSFDWWEWTDCRYNLVEITANFDLKEKDLTILDDDYVDSSPTRTAVSYDCDPKTLIHTFENVHIDSSLYNDEYFDGALEFFVEAKGGSISGTSSCNSRSKDVDLDVVNGQCAAGTCCALGTCNYMAANTQPKDTNDYYSCSGTNSPTLTSYVVKNDYYCSGISPVKSLSSSDIDTCGICEYCTSGDSSCNPYPSGQLCGTTDCNYKDTECRNYNNVNSICNGASSCVDGSCSSSYTDEQKGKLCNGGNGQCDGLGNCAACENSNQYTCYDNDVYWKDSCGNIDGIKEECGDNALVTEKICGAYNNVLTVRKFTEKGCISSKCFVSESSLVIGDESCDSGYQCVSGECKPAPQCTSNGQCGTDGWIGSPRCSDVNVWPNYITYSCSSGQCTSSQQFIQKEICSNGCSAGQCIGSGSCTDECAFNEFRCNGNNLQSCGTFDEDTCTEFGADQYWQYGCEDLQCKSQPSEQDCSVIKWGVEFNGVSGELGANGDTRFYCLNKRFYECGWEFSDSSFAYEMKHAE